MWIEGYSAFQGNQIILDWATNTLRVVIGTCLHGASKPRRDTRAANEHQSFKLARVEALSMHRSIVATQCTGRPVLASQLPLSGDYASDESLSHDGWPE